MKKALYWTSGIVVVLAGVFAIGPRPVVGDLSGELPTVNANLIDLEQEINRREAANSLIKSDNQAASCGPTVRKRRKPP